MIRDAAVVTRMTPEQWAEHPAILDLARGRGIRIPPLSEVADDVEPIPAFVNRGKWIALCPEPVCFGQAEDVWRNWPYFLCMRCGNRMVGGRWRPVAFPDDLTEIEAAMDLRPIEDQNWHATEPGLGGPVIYYADDDPEPFMTIEQQNRAMLRAGLVGDSGPEVFVPAQDGTIIPASALRAGNDTPGSDING